MISFIVRFVPDQPYDAAAADEHSTIGAWHGIIRHVQSDAERHFARWSDAIAFIAEYVDLEPVDAAGQRKEDAPKRNPEPIL
jgi:hypothetical protein